MLSLRPRTGEPSRIEAFSDGVFAFATTLLVVSQQVPRTDDDLIETMIGLAGCVYAGLGPVHAVHGSWSYREVPETLA